MVIVFITAFAFVFAILLLTGIGLYFWQKTARDDAERILPPSPDFHGLFGEQPDNQMKTAEELERARLLAAALLERARAGDKSALIEAQPTGNSDLYDQVLNEFVQQLDSDAALVSLLSFVVKSDLRINVSLANAAVTAWQNAPSRQGTAKALHFAALSDDAELYRRTIDVALQLWREGKLANVSPDELRALFDGEFWILSARTRSSGAGFVLKRTLESARRELERSVSSPSVSKGHLSNEALPSDHPTRDVCVGTPSGRASETN